MPRARTALISGAAGAIGAAVARRLHAEGVQIVGVDITADGFSSLVESIPGIRVLVADVATSAGADRAISAAGGRIDILINNAGVADGGGSIDETDDAVWSRVIAVNLTAAFMLSQRVVAAMLQEKSGVIINMSSVAGLRGGRTGVAYTSSKWGLVGMAQNIASSLGPDGIRAYAICPGVVSGALTLGNTPSTARSVRNRGRDRGQPPATTPEDVAELVAFLASDKARHLNGIAVPIDQGWLAY